MTTNTAAPTEKAHENRLRRMAERQGLELRKSRRRDPRALDFGRFQLTRGRTMLVDTKGLDEIEAYLKGER